MWRSKKFIIVAVVAAVLLVASVGGIALAQTGTASAGTGKTLLARVATILGIDQQKVEDAFSQAQREMREEALDNYLKGLVASGKITQEQADQYKKWSQSRPDLTQYRQQLKDWQQTRPGIPPALKEWQEARPDIPGAFGFGPRGGFRGGFGFPGRW
ncbi:MAG: hypothetical protein HYX79_02085 [Chloroflexi bacterium]|nr:hypothetical protein [Chloroflexota bacterium]